MYKALLRKDKTMAVIGLGYVGLPLALQMASRFRVIGFDISEERVAMMQRGEDPSFELEAADFIGKDIRFTTDEADLAAAQFFIVAVPTPVDEHRVPDLRALFQASKSVGKALQEGGYVVYESTVYPGCTEEDCLPFLEAGSGLQLGQFKLGYSPERMNPGDKVHSVDAVTKVVSGSDAEALEEIAKVYSTTIKAGVFKATSIKVAEAAKAIENTQRDLNISFMNELAIMFDRMGIDTQEVLDAASTKWNFHRFTPGLVGGHCVSVDPYYLLHKSKQLGYDPQVILSGRRVNDSMPGFIAKRLVQMLIHQGKSLRDCRVLTMGVTFKENVADIRNSRVADLVKELQDYAVQVDVMDPHAIPAEVEKMYGLSLMEEPQGPYDAIIIAVAHTEYRAIEISYYKELLAEHSIFMDLKAIYSRPASDNGMEYWRL